MISTNICRKKLDNNEFNNILFEGDQEINRKKILNSLSFKENTLNKDLMIYL